MTKKLLSYLLAVALLITSLNMFTVQAVTSNTTEQSSARSSSGGLAGTEGLTYQCYASVNGRPYCGYVTGYTGTEKDVVIPTHYNGYTIIGINGSAFYKNTNITSVTIANTVEKIGGNAFYGCTSLKNVYIPSSVTDMSGSQMFLDCVSLESIVIPNSVTKVGSSMFMDCENLKTVILSDQITAIPGQMFCGCDNLTELVIPQTVTEIGVNAFSGCKALTKITIPKSVTNIKGSAFASCSNLTIYCEVDSQPSTWSSSWNYSRCPVVYGREVSSIEITKLPSKQKYLKGVEQLDVSDGKIFVTYKNGDEEEVSISASMVTGFNNQTLGEQLLTIQYGGKTATFNVEVYVEILGSGSCGSNATWKLENTGLLKILGTGAIDDYDNASSPWETFKDSITSITISNGITQIGKNAFAGCNNINVINIPITVTSIANDSIATNDNMVVCSYYDTPAETYANQNDIEFNPISILSGISVTEPSKKVYREGDEFDPTGITVSVTYEDGTTVKVDNFGLSEFNSTVGKQRITVSYRTISAVLYVEVTPFKGSGTEEDPFLIENKYHLDQVRNYVHYSFKLTTDIIFTDADFKAGGDYYNNGTGWQPIGAVAFYGTFDGNGHIIKNLRANISSTSETARFGLFTSNSGTIKNLGVVECNVTVKTSDNVYASAACITAGNSHGAIISNCYATGKISIDSGAYAYAGGITTGNSGRIEKCYSNVDLSAVSSYYERNAGYYAYAGGISTGNDAYTTSIVVRGEIIDCYNLGNIYASSEGYVAGTYVGGITPENRGLVKNCYNIGVVSSKVNGTLKTTGGAVVGYNSSNAIVENCYYLDNMEDNSALSIVCCSSSDMINQNTFIGFDFESTWTMSGSDDYLYPKLRGQTVYFEKELSSVSVTEIPERTAMISKANVIDLIGGKLQLNYSGGSTKEITLTSDMIGAVAGLGENIEVTVQYQGMETSFSTFVYDYISGDVNEDGVVNIKDATLLRRFVAEWDDVSVHESAADVNRDGVINVKDATLLRRYVAEWDGVVLK